MKKKTVRKNRTKEPSSLENPSQKKSFVRKRNPNERMLDHDQLPIFDILRSYSPRQHPCAFFWGPADSQEFYGNGTRPCWPGLMATELEEIDWITVENLRCGVPLKSQAGLKSIIGTPYILGLISYDDYEKASGSQEIPPESPSRAFLVKKGWKLTDWRKRVQYWEPIGLDAKDLSCLRVRADYPGKDDAREPLGGWVSGLSLQPDSSKEDYLEDVRSILEAIRNGDYYQLNLLRYFKVDHVDVERLIALITHRPGPMGSWIRAGDVEVFSLSPERMLQLMSQGEETVLQASPIKGTSRRGETPIQDLNLAQELLDSAKNRAELAMIIDLMRNDFHKVCLSGSVRALDFKLQTLTNVHHLVGQVSGIIRPDLTYGELFQNLLPGGSITGAPKKAVMRAIKRLERRSRGYFMGHSLMIGPEGGADCSILIRTMIRNGGSDEDVWEFAAGSGIVIHSDPLEEYDEIEVKSSILT